MIATPPSKLTGWLWVVAQVVLLGALVLVPRVPNIALLHSWQPLAILLQIIGMGIVLIGALNLGPSLTPLPLPRARASLRTDHLFHYVRHPIYSGALVWALGMTLASGSLYRLALFAFIWVFFSAKARFEESLLIQQFPDYREYLRRTPRFVPKLKNPWRRSGT